MTTPGCKCIITMPLFLFCASTYLSCMILIKCIEIHFKYIYKGVELTWNYGSEAEEGMVYNTGNADTTGTGDGSKIRGGESVAS